MTVSSFDPSVPVTVTDAAIKYFTAQLAKKGGDVIRLSTKKSGCTGYAYVLDYAKGTEENDIVLAPSEHVTLAIAEDAVTQLQGMEIDLAIEGLNKVVKFNNPNVTAECGCGESFSVE